LTSQPIPGSEPAGARERILVALASAQNQRLLGAMLARRYDVEYDLGAPSIDLCIVDGLSLHRSWQQLLALREASEPVLLPVLLLSDRRDVGLTTRAAWRVADDVLLRPVEQLELAARVEALLRARRLSLRLERMAAMYEHEKRIAQRLQAEALPRGFPDVPGLAFDAFYHAGADDARIGGDWYDALRLSDGRIVISVGDVSGSGLEAAVTMANVRQILRGVAQIHPDPAMMLDAADRTLQAESSDRFVTAFVGVLDPVTWNLSYASAGHPRPLLRERAGRLSELRASGLPLGAPGRVLRSTENVTLPPEALLVLYTDGLTEATHDVDEGEGRLRAALGDTGVLDDPQLARSIHDAVVPGRASDDVAVFVVRRCGDAAAEGAVLRFALDSSDAGAAREARHAISDALGRHGFSADALGAAEVVLAELLGNVVRYAQGPVEIALDRSGVAPVLHVLDRGRGFRHLPKLPADVLSERGRGLYIVSALADDFAVTRRPDGGSHARAVLALSANAPSALDPFLAFPDLDTMPAR
jgi:serine phosphatase RsbU (regulator of sigma subunit)/anti-sigma regulatory factor (Ser/Thr protein kinase)